MILLQDFNLKTCFKRIFSLLTFYFSKLSEFEIASNINCYLQTVPIFMLLTSVSIGNTSQTGTVNLLFLA